MVWLNLTIEPSALMLGAEFDAISDSIKTYRVPLERSVREVMRYSLQENFHAEGRPDKWTPLADSTILRKGFSNILLLTGTLYHTAGQLNIWSYTSDTAQITNLGKADYGVYHQMGYGQKYQLISQGSNKVPAREWALIQDPEDYDAIQQIFEEWLMEKFGEHWNDVSVES